jgi:hypothetical protein
VLAPEERYRETSKQHVRDRRKADILQGRLPMPLSAGNYVIRGAEFFVR